MISFPKLTKWFDIVQYVDHNGCRKIEINMKILSEKEVDEFCYEFAIYMCRLRCINDEYYSKMKSAIKGNYILNDKEKSVLKNCFFSGFISEKKLKKTRDCLQSFDEEGIKGYFGECFYYILRHQILEDEKIYIEPKFPKYSSKTSGIDFIDIRKDVNGFYMIIGEIKTTKNKYTDRLSEILDVFANRIDKNFSEMYQLIKDNDKKDNEEYSKFLEEMLSCFYNISGSISEKKRLSGVINYNYEGDIIDKTTFKNVPTRLKDVVVDSSICRRFKLIGIYDIENVIKQTRDIIWNVL